MDSTRDDAKGLILIPALITLAVTLLRLTGELLGWSNTLFSPEAGGNASPVGIVWLVPIFGIYFAWRLAKSGEVSVGALRTIGYAVLGLVVVIAAAALASSLLGPTSVFGLIIIAIVSLVATWLVTKGWSELASTLLTYALAARIPVAVIMFFAILGEWGTHYDVPPPDFPVMSWFPKWVVIGLVPQLTIWVAFTVIVGAIFGGIVLAVVGRRSS